eukprot:TRINITY_DN1985_c2_g1_i4.p3 TRINITY_DN1985_c2_g1~~TRINITY_DN1985_c2_g1_i4.p3  ORF type:complete len:218 (-),score=5.88 TRINITY_DN1985_c2_g1_i4:7-660(-)
MLQQFSVLVLESQYQKSQLQLWQESFAVFVMKKMKNSMYSAQVNLIEYIAAIVTLYIASHLSVATTVSMNKWLIVVREDQRMVHGKRRHKPVGDLIITVDRNNKIITGYDNHKLEIFYKTQIQCSMQLRVGRIQLNFWEDDLKLKFQSCITSNAGQFYIFDLLNLLVDLIGTKITKQWCTMNSFEHQLVVTLVGNCNYVCSVKYTDIQCFVSLLSNS